MHGYVFTHIPVHPSQFKRFAGNVHGHTHSNKLDDLRYIPACLEHHGLKPVLLDKLLADHHNKMNALVDESDPSTAL
jgi:calcineurin-like phosphoesterase family protein